MTKETKYWVEFSSPGCFFFETEEKDITDPNPRKIKWPDNAFAFQIYEREDVIDGKTRYKGTPKKVGPTYYHPDSKVETLEEVKRNPKASEILISNMTHNQWDRIIWTRWGQAQPYDPKNTKIL